MNLNKKDNVKTTNDRVVSIKVILLCSDTIILKVNKIKGKTYEKKILEKK